MIISLIHANSSIIATPGSDKLWSVHSGQYRGMRRLASSTMSWNRRSSRVGGGSVMSSLLGDHVEGVDEVVAGVGRPDRVRETDQHPRGVAGVGNRPDVVELDARLP